MKKSEIIERYGVEEYERRLEHVRQYNAEHREEIAERNKQYRAENKEERAVYQKQYDAAHREQRTAYMKQYRTTRIGRANCLAGRYRQMDKQKGFLNVENQVDSKFILNNIFNYSCVYCGESDWHLLGCDRIDNSKPHTRDNVVCCCWDCNNERKAMNFDKFMAMKKKIS